MKTKAAGSSSRDVTCACREGMSTRAEVALCGVIVLGSAENVTKARAGIKFWQKKKKRYMTDSSLIRECVEISY